MRATIAVVNSRGYEPLVRDAVSVERLRHDLPVYPIDGSYLKRLDNMPGSPGEQAAELGAAIKFEVRVRDGEKDPVARSIAERLEEVRKRKVHADQEMLDLLKEIMRAAADRCCGGARGEATAARLPLDRRPRRRDAY